MFLDETWTPLFHLKTSFFNGHCYPALIWFNPRKSYFPNNFWVIFFLLYVTLNPACCAQSELGVPNTIFFTRWNDFLNWQQMCRLKNKQFFQERILTNLFSHGLKNLKKCKAFEWVSAWAKLFTFHNLRQKQMKKKKLL